MQMHMEVMHHPCTHLRLLPTGLGVPRPATRACLGSSASRPRAHRNSLATGTYAAYHGEGSGHGVQANTGGLLGKSSRETGWLAG